MIRSEWGPANPVARRFVRFRALVTALLVAVAADAAPPSAKPAASADAPAKQADSAASLERRTLTIPSATSFTLDNGLRIVLQEARHQPQVGVLVAYEIGSRDDPVGYGELAHLVEHMTYRGSLHLGPYAGMDLLERLGATWQNGMTTPDFTAYFALVPARALANALWIESERMAFTLERFDERSLELERDTVRNERLLRMGPDDLLDHHARRIIFGEGHPYGGPAFVGQDLNAIELSHVQWFFQQSHRPNNAHLILVGDFESRRARELVELYFGRIVNPELQIRRRSSTWRPFSSKRTLTLEIGSLREATMVYWPALTANSADVASARLYARVMRARLEESLVRQRGLASQVTLELYKLDLGSFFKLSVEHRPTISHADVEREIGSIFRHADRIAWDESLSLARKEAVLEELLELENPIARAIEHLVTLRTTGSPFVVSRRIAELKAVKPDDLRRQARSMAAGQRVVARLQRPQGLHEIPPWGRLTVEE